MDEEGGSFWSRGHRNQRGHRGDGLREHMDVLPTTRASQQRATGQRPSVHHIRASPSWVDKQRRGVHLSGILLEGWCFGFSTSDSMMTYIKVIHPKVIAGPRI